MKRSCVILAITAGVILCGFQQEPPPQNRKANQQSAQTAKPEPEAAPESPKPSPPKGASANKNTDGIEGDGDKNVQIISTTPEKPIDLVEHITSIIGVICTLALAAVGIKGIRIALGTLREMKGQRRAMLGQLRAMRRTLSEVQKQADEMVKQTGHLEGSVAAAKDSAKAAQDNIELLINKERARIVIEQPEPFRMQVGEMVVIQYKLSYYGSTPAYDIDTEVNSVMHQSKDHPNNPFLRDVVQGLPKVVISPQALRPTGYMTNLIAMDDRPSIKLDVDTFKAVEENRLYVHFWGFIKYKDFMGKLHTTPFRYRWLQVGPKENSQRWEKYGPPEDNQET